MTAPSADYTMPVIVATVILASVAIVSSTVAAIFAPSAAPVIAAITGIPTIILPLIFGVLKIREVQHSVNGLNAAATAAAEVVAGDKGVEIGGRMDPTNPASVAAAKVEMREATDATAAARIETMAAATGDPVAGVATPEPKPPAP